MHGITNRGQGRRTLAMAVLLTTVALAATACGSSEGPGRTVASVAPQAGSAPTATQAATGNGDLLAYAKCMRQNGLPDFPDPKPGGVLAFGQGDSINPTSPEFKEAESHCKQFMPGTPEVKSPEDQWSSADKLKYAKCMRDNGVSQFPDPAGNGGFKLPQGIDPMSPQFKKAEAACAKYQPQNIAKTGPGGDS
ncbi:hypothetical protein GCM10010404_39890 [Nonomuraea africana]|uniref:Lipoprotein n=1 Tax=Nonomuraea africana TaxID=46171 RepID=A0ABR9KWG1_9ACTN|nr:hypothetical protein [Nonomuraea africana]MBE1565872.1 hypothetical protein [Nonomuraea africana]